MLKAIVVLLFAGAVVVIAGLLFALPVMWLWNWLMPVIFGLKTIGLLQAWGLNVLCGFLFKSSSTSK